MGGCFSSPSTEDERHRQVEQAIKEDKKSWGRRNKVLLLGTANSGKSTVLKQMRVINSMPFTQAEVETYRQLIFGNIVGGLQAVYELMEEEGIEPAEDTARAFSEMQSVPDLKDHEVYPIKYKAIFEQVWGDADVQKAVILGQQTGLPDNLSYYLEHLERLFQPNYVPTQQDIVHSRARTTGIYEIELTIQKQAISLIDVGGQRSERRKWIHCFQDVTSILFLVSLSGYDQTLTEDHETNQMQDSMIVWESICSSPWFEHTSFILFLNKEDLFQQKVTHSNIKRHFPDYDGEEGNAKDGLNYFKRRFLRIHTKTTQAFHSKSAARPKMPQSQGHKDVRKVYPYFTTATDTEMITHVLAFVNDIILLDNLVNSAIL